MPESPYYKAYESNTFSQNGEDGVLDAIFNELGVDVSVCCEYGGHDGIHASNTRKYLVERGVKVLYIEGDTDLFQSLKSNTKDYPSAIIENCFVACESGTFLCDLLLKHHFPIDFDLLSVDIDGCDHWSLSHIGNYRPKVIVIEVNSGLDPLVPPTMPLNAGAFNFTSSMTFLNEMGYDVVHHTGNMISVRSDLSAKLKIPSNQINSRNLFNSRWR